MSRFDDAFSMGQRFVIGYYDANGHEDDEEILYWSNTIGWTSFDNATYFAEEEMETYNTPIGGEWEEIAGYTTVTGVYRHI